MRKHRISLSAIALAALGGGLFAAPQELSEREHKELGKWFGKYLEAKADPEDLEDVKEDLVKSLAKIGKKLVDKDGDPVQAALALTADLGKAAALATDYKNARGGKPIEGEIELGGTKVTYTVWVPKTYRSTGDPLPTVIVLPGLHEGKPMPSSQFLVEHWTESAVRDGALIAVVDMPQDVAVWDELRVGAGGANVMLTLRDLRNTYAVDSNRVYLLGMEAGVPAAMSIASKYPHLFAGVIGQAGDVGAVGFENFRNLPVYLQGASAEGEAFKAATEQAEYGNCEMHPAASVDDIWAWMQEHPRNSNPSAVTLALGSPIPNKAYWIEVPPTDGAGIVITAKADREANIITINGTGVPSVTLFLNDEIVDLNRPLRIVLNGVEQTERIPRSVEDMLSLLKRGTSDPGKFYVAAKTYDLPE